MKFAGEITPTDRPANIEISSNYDGQYTRILINCPKTAEPGTIELLHYNGTGKLIEAQASTYEGFEISVATKELGSGSPETFVLHQNFPNPFNNETSIRLDLPIPAFVKFEIVNTVGQVVYDFRRQYSSGSHTIFWDGVDKSGHSVSSGVYHYRLTIGNFAASRKMILLK